MLSLLTIHWRSIGLLYLLYIPQHTTAWVIHLVLSIPLLPSLFFYLFACHILRCQHWVLESSPHCGFRVLTGGLMLPWLLASLDFGKAPEWTKKSGKAKTCCLDFPVLVIIWHLGIFQKKKKKKHQYSFLKNKKKTLSDQFMSMNIISPYLCKGYKLLMHVTGNKTKYSPYHGGGCTLAGKRAPWTVSSWFPK